MSGRPHETIARWCAAWSAELARGGADSEDLELLAAVAQLRGPADGVLAALVDHADALAAFEQAREAGAAGLDRNIADRLAEMLLEEIDARRRLREALAGPEARGAASAEVEPPPTQPAGPAALRRSRPPETPDGVEKETGASKHPLLALIEEWRNEPGDDEQDLLLEEPSRERPGTPEPDDDASEVARLRRRVAQLEALLEEMRHGGQP